MCGHLSVLENSVGISIGGLEGRVATGVKGLLLARAFVLVVVVLLKALSERSQFRFAKLHQDGQSGAAFVVSWETGMRGLTR